MTLIPGNKRLLYVGTQVAKGTAQDTPTKCIRVTDFTPNPVRQLLQLAETDSAAQEAADVVVGVTPGFSFTQYMRPSELAFWFAALLGNNADTGSTPNYTHTADPDDTQPYVTVFEREPSTMCNKYIDGHVVSMTVRGGAAQALEVTVVVETLDFAAGATAPTTPAAITELPLTYPEVTITKNGSAPGTFSEFEITINRNSTRAQGDNGLKSIDCQVGKLSVVGSLTKYFESDADQRLVDTGSTSGTSPTTTIGSQTLVILASRNANLRVTFDMDGVSFPTAQRAVRTDGTPLVEVLGFRTVPQATLAGNIQVIVKDQSATPDS